MLIYGGLGPQSTYGSCFEALDYVFVVNQQNNEFYHFYIVFSLSLPLVIKIIKLQVNSKKYNEFF